MITKQKCLEIACRCFFSDYPTTVDVEDVLINLEDYIENHKVVVWQPLEEYDGDYIYSCVLNLAEDIKKTMGAQDEN